MVFEDDLTCEACGKYPAVGVAAVPGKQMVNDSLRAQGKELQWFNGEVNKSLRESLHE